MLPQILGANCSYAEKSRAIQAVRCQKTHQPDAEMCKILSKKHVMLLLNSFSDPNGEDV